jgi:hypothetical protein
LLNAKCRVGERGTTGVVLIEEEVAKAEMVI